MDLRTDAEFRGVQQVLRGAKYRELVEIQQRPAATFFDLLVHFSGHGGGEAIGFEQDDPEANDGHAVVFDLLMEALEATDEPPQMLVLNACETLAGADKALSAVPVIIAMSDVVLDLAATVFTQCAGRLARNRW